MPAEPSEHERRKYEGIYRSSSYARYGHSNHGGKATALLQAMGPASLLDVGCGYNEFCAAVRVLLPSIRVLGVDFACPGADLLADACALPFAAKEFDVLTAFDMLEHVLPEQVHGILSEFARVSQRFIFSISNVPSVYKWEGETLHPTVRDPEWWRQTILKVGGLPVLQGHYWTGHWMKNHIPV